MSKELASERGDKEKKIIYREGKAYARALWQKDPMS